MSSSTAHFRFVAVGFLLIACVNLAIDVIKTQGTGRNLSAFELARYRGGQTTTYDDQCCVVVPECDPGVDIFCKNLNDKQCVSQYSEEWPSVKRRHCDKIKGSDGKKCTVTKDVHACYISHSCIWDAKDGCVNFAVAGEVNAPDECADDCML